MRTNYLKILKKFLAAACMLLMTIPSWAQVDEQLSQNSLEEKAAMEVARKTVDAYEAGNWEVIRNNVSPDAHFYNLGSYDSLSVKEALDYWKKGRSTASPVLSDKDTWLAVNFPDGPRKGKWVLYWGENTLTYPNGESITFPYHVAMRFKGDKISNAHFYYDNNIIIRAMGFELQPPLEEEKQENGLESLLEDTE